MKRGLEIAEDADCRPADESTGSRGAAVSTSDVADAVRTGLIQSPKQLPSWLFYDAHGSQLFEQITDLPEYYLSRAERSIFETHADEIVAAAAHGDRGPLGFAELGVGTAAKTVFLLRSAVRRQGSVTFIASDVSEGALQVAARRVSSEEPQVKMQKVVGPHERALAVVSTLANRQVVLFLGSSIGNYVGDQATTLLRSVRQSLRQGASLILGADLRKDPAVLVRAYDDSAGVTAAFNKNVLARLNRELGADFELERFRHVALWNEEASRIEMHLESLVEQVAVIRALGMTVALRPHERIHTESSVKYDDLQVDRLLVSSGFGRTETFYDRECQFAVHVAHAL